MRTRRQPCIQRESWRSPPSRSRTRRPAPVAATSTTHQRPVIPTREPPSSFGRRGCASRWLRVDSRDSRPTREIPVSRRTSTKEAGQDAATILPTCTERQSDCSGTSPLPRHTVLTHKVRREYRLSRRLRREQLRASFWSHPFPPWGADHLANWPWVRLEPTGEVAQTGRRPDPRPPLWHTRQEAKVRCGRAIFLQPPPRRVNHAHDAGTRKTPIGGGCGTQLALDRNSPTAGQPHRPPPSRRNKPPSGGLLPTD